MSVSWEPERCYCSMVILEVTALIIESVSAAASILSEAKHRKGSQSGSGMAAALATLDLETVLSSTSSARFAAMMRGSMTADDFKRISSDSQVSRIIAQMVMASVVEDERDTFEAIEGLLKARIEQILRSSVGKDDLSFFVEEFSGLVRTHCAEVVDAALTVAPDSVIAVQQLTVMKRSQAVLGRVSDQLAAMTRSGSEEQFERRVQFVSEYRAICAEVHGSIKPPDFETNQRIPLEDLYVAPIVQPRRSDYPGQRIDPAKFSKLVDRTVLLGDPGGGKSTLSNYLTMIWSRDLTGPVPFHVTLREFALESDTMSILQYIESQLPSKYQIHPVEGAIEDLLAEGNAVVVFDGLDELTDPTKRRAMTSAVEAFAFRYPMIRIFVTSRRVGYEQAQLDPASFRSFVIDGFDSTDVSEYVQKWFASQSAYSDVEASKRAAEFMSQSQAVAELSSNPLMLSLMCIIFRGENFIPRNRPAIYEKCANLLFEKWDGHRQIEVPLQAKDYVDAAMKHVAFMFLQSGASDTGMRREALVLEMTDYLFPRAMETRERAGKAAEEFVDFCAGRAWVFSDAGSTGDGEPLFTFTHRTFMEYFAAIHLTRISDTPAKLAQALLPRIAREEWDVVGQLAVQQMDRSHDRGTERVLRAMLDDPRRRRTSNRAHVLLFIVRCCEFAVVSPMFLQSLATVCFDFFADAERHSVNVRDHALPPILRLQEFVPVEQTTLVADQIRKTLAAALDEPDGVRLRSAIFLVLLGLVRKFNGLSFEGSRNERASVWDALFVDIATEREPVFRAAFEDHPTGWINFVLGGVVSPEVGIDEMKRAGLSFAEVYFANCLVHGSDVSGGSLATVIAGPLRRAATGDLPNRAIVEPVVRLLLEDYGNPDRSRVIGGLAKGYERRYELAFSSIRARPIGSQDFADFVLISAMAAEEVTIASDEDTRHRAFDRAVVDEIGASAQIREFARHWLDDETSIFDR